MSLIKSIQARQILDSRGIPTVEALLTADDGYSAIASIPSGTSTGSHEAKELRDADPLVYQGSGVLKAVENINRILAPALIGKDPTRQTEIDQILIDLDGTADKNRLGANAILAASQGVCELGAAVTGYPTYKYLHLKYRLSERLDMPTPIFNVINGGKHGTGNLDFQEFHVIPATNKTYSQALECGEVIYQILGDVLAHRGAIRSVGVEGGYAPNLFTNTEALELIFESVRQSGFEFARDVFLGLDVAATSFYNGHSYAIRDKSQALSRSELLEFYREINDKFHLFGLEDPFAEDDLEGWKQITAAMARQTIIIGDDLLTTNKQRTKDAVDKQLCTGILVKPNQIGTISETIEVIKIALAAKWHIVVSHRSGETNDDFIADFAVGVNANHVKFGAPARGERVAKYNRLLQIEEELK
ncbi:phosphopyruvate hydratase [Candidatus Collierbacteria bacterium]|nr:phosphopyruvate hydratase [Candidatus Collierbacteria bacterium]